MSRCLVVLGFLSLLIPGIAGASSKGPARQAKNRQAAVAKKSKEKMALGKAKTKNKGGKGSAKAAGFLPRPGTKPAGKQPGAAKLAGTRTASVAKTTARASTAKSKRTTIARKTRTTRKTRKPTTRKRAARTQRSRSRSSQQFDTGAAAELGAEAPDGMMPGEMGAMEMGPARPQSRFRRILGATGRALKKTAKYAGYGLVVAAPAVVMAVGGLPIAFAIGAPAIFLGIPMAIGLAEQAAKQRMGIDDPQQEMLERYMSRQMLENQDLNGPGPGNGVAGIGGLNTLNNMIDPGGMR